jgi:hypothetical protein
MLAGANQPSSILQYRSPGIIKPTHDCRASYLLMPSQISPPSNWGRIGFYKIFPGIYIPYYSRTWLRLAGENAESNNTASSLHKLPTELILNIVQSLSPGDELSLGFTCRRFYYTFGFARCRSKPTSQLERFDFLCRLERDRNLAREWRLFSKFLCCGCHCSHRSFQFAPSQLKIDPRNRRCLSTDPLLWVDPGVVWSYASIKQMADDESKAFWLLSNDNTGPILLTRPTPRLIRRSKFNKSVLIVDVFSISHSRAPTNCFVSKEEAEASLLGFDIPICPHIHLRHPSILQHYDPPTLSPDSSDQKNAFYKSKEIHCAAKNCRTSYHFSSIIVREGIGRGKVLNCSVKRDLGKLKSPRDSAWLAQLMTADADSLKSHWNRCDAWRHNRDNLQKLLSYSENENPLFTREFAEIIAKDDELCSYQQVDKLCSPFWPQEGSQLDDISELFLRVWPKWLRIRA